MFRSSFIFFFFFFVIFPLLLQTSVLTSSTLIISNMSLCSFNMDYSGTNKKKEKKKQASERTKTEICFCNFSHLLKGLCINAMAAHGPAAADHFKCMLQYMICFSFSVRFHFMWIPKRLKKIENEEEETEVEVEENKH